MGSTSAFLLTVGLLVAALAAAYVPVGDHLARTFTSTRHLRVERLLYRSAGIDPDADQTWATYLRSLLAFSLVGVLGLYALLRLQDRLPLDGGRPAVGASQAFETAASFVTNTDWQSYAGESTMSTASQALGLAVQNVLSAAVGLAVAVALVRGFTRSRTGRLGSFWVDLVRGTVRVLLPMAAVLAVLLLAAGVVQDLDAPATHRTVAGAAQTLPLGPVASQEAVKQLGTNGGGFYAANSAHPFENPNPFTNLLQVFAMLLLPVALTRAFGRMVGDPRQGLAVLATMAVLLGASLAVAAGVETAHPGTVPQAVGAATEGKEVRFGVPQSALFSTATTGTSTGATSSAHDSWTAFGGGALLVNMVLGEVTPGGVGAGLYGFLVVATLAVFVAGLMVGRTPEYLQKRIGSREVQLVALYVLATPAVLLVGTAVALSLPSFRAGLGNDGPHGFTEVLYAFASASGNNGSAFGGLTTATTSGNTALGLCMLAGRFVPIALVLALAGSLAQQVPVPRSAGTLPTHTPLFVALVAGVLLVVSGLTYLPALVLGPIAEGLS